MEMILPIKKIVLLCWVAISGGMLLPGNLWSQTLVLEPVLSGFTSPLYVTNAHDGSDRLFILEQEGRIKVLQPGVTTPTLFLDLTSRVLAGGERGLLGLAFHPQFANNRRFFVNYTRKPDGATVIAEYHVATADGNIADTQETILLTVPQPFANHNGGMIEFGPDSFLYIGMGDGGSGDDPDNRAQNTEDLLGKILRIDVDHPQSLFVPYSSPASNPFFGSMPGRDEIFALGLRNPWRFSFDIETGQLYVADVGQNEREEIDIVTRGGNYGWRVFEGTRCTTLGPAPCQASDFIAPIAEYEHTADRCSIIGGYIYRGAAHTLPEGAYVYGDLCSGEIFLLEAAGQRLLLDSDLAIASFGEDEAGELYVVGLGGTLYRLINPNPPPSAIEATFESPEDEEIVSGVALIRGWAFATQPGVQIGSVEGFIDGVFAGDIPCCSDRADVQAAFSQFPPQNTLKSGWATTLNWGVLTAGRHTVRVVIKNTAGQPLSIKTRTVTVAKPGDFEFLDQFSLTQATTRIEGEELVVEGVIVRDKTSQQQKGIDLRLSWVPSSQSFGTIHSTTLMQFSATPSRFASAWSVIWEKIKGVTASAHASPSVVAAFEGPEAGQIAAGIGVLRGWAFADMPGAAITEVRLVIDGIAQGTVPCCSARGDIAAAYPGNPSALTSGWGATFNYGILTPGFHIFGVQITDSVGASFSDSHGVTVVKIAGFEFLDQVNLSGATARREGEDIVLEGVQGRDQASQQTHVVTMRLRWLPSAQALSIVASTE
jgi:glucose/arabinose dehydrogenase